MSVHTPSDDFGAGLAGAHRDPADGTAAVAAQQAHSATSTASADHAGAAVVAADQDEVRRFAALPVRRFVSLVAITALVGAGAFVYLSAQEPRFTAQTSLVFSAQITVVGTATRRTEASEQTLNTQATVMTTSSAVRRAAETAGTSGDGVSASATVQPSSSIVDLTAEADTMAAARATADALAQQYISDAAEQDQAIVQAQVSTLTSRAEELTAGLDALAAQIAEEEAAVRTAAIQGQTSVSNALLTSLQNRYSDLADEESSVEDDITQAETQGTAAPAVGQLDPAVGVSTTQRGLLTRIVLALGTGLLVGVIGVWLLDVARRSEAVADALRGRRPRRPSPPLAPPGS